jgi:membrane-bound lytic murein transglycosylase MltF
VQHTRRQCAPKGNPVFGRILLAVLATMLIASCGSATPAPDVRTLEPGVLKVCLYPGFAPFSEQDDKGEFIGWDIAYLKDFAATQGLRVEAVEAKSFDGIWLEPAKGTCDVAASGISDAASRRVATGEGAQWTQHYYNVLRAFLVRSGDAGSLTSIEDLRGRTVVVTANSTADDDLRNRLQRAGITTTKIVDTASDEDAARDVQDAGPAGEPFAFAAGLGTVELLAKRLPGLEVAWPHCNMLADGTNTQESFSFVVRSESTGLLDALNGFIASPDAKYQGKPETDPDCVPLPSS